MELAISMFLAEEITADDERLNYLSYEELGLLCPNPKCRELVFLKPCIEGKRVPHFSHYKDTGKKCFWKTKSNASTITQHTDSESREQSLEKFQSKFKDILDQAIIDNPNQTISDINELKNCKLQGISLVNKYKIDIKSWLRLFNQKRESISKLALSLYNNNNELSEIQCRVLANIVDYLCVPASEYILEDTFYYVFSLLNKNVSVNNDYQEVCSKVIELIRYVNWEKEYKRPKELVERQRPKPIKLDGAKVAQGTVIFRSVVGTTPLLACLEPSGKEWKLIGLPVKVPEYDLARYVVGNLSPNQAIAYLHREIDRLKNQNQVNSLKLIARLENLLIQVVQGKKLNPESLRESTVVIRKYLDKAGFKHNSLYTDNYYRSHTLADVSFIQELEAKKLTYKFIWGSERAIWQSEVSMVIKWLKRVPARLGKQFPINFPSFEEVRDYLLSIFKFENVELIIKEERGIYIEIYYEGMLQSRQLLDITSQISKDRIAGKVSTKVSTSIQYVGDGEFYSLLRCTSVDRQLVREAKSQLEKIVQKFVDSNIQLFTKEKEEKIVSKVALKDLLGFSKDSKGFPQVAKQFNKFTLPFTSESEVNLGKLVNLLTLETYDRHDTANLLDKMVNNWKHWNQSNTVNIAGFSFIKKDPGELMVNIFHTVKHNQDRSDVVWGAFIDELYKLSNIPIGFRTSEGVLLTPWSLYTDHVSRWEHRIKIQLISILKDGDNSRTRGIEALLQQDIKSLKKTLDKMQPGWLSNNADISKHLEALEDCLRTVKQLRGQD